MNRPTARKPASGERRAAILTAALDEFSGSGFSAARLDDVARRAGVAKGTIYLYFRDKETLFQELIRDLLAPIVQILETIEAPPGALRATADRMVELFISEVLETKRKDVIRLIITEGPRFPKLAEFYYSEVLSRGLGAVRAILSKAAERGEVPAALARHPQIVVSPGIVAVVWSGLFDRFEPLDVRAMMKAHLDMLFAPGRAG